MLLASNCFMTEQENTNLNQESNLDLEIKPNIIYTTDETQKLLKISNSTMKRLLKSGLIKANKVGCQYRILGKEILRMVSPEVERGAVKAYLKIKQKVVDKINKW